MAATLVHRAIGNRLTCVFVDNGVLRKDEFQKVQRNLRDLLGLHLVAVDASARFLKLLSGVSDPEKKRRIIGREFIAVFEEEARRIAKEEGHVEFLVQGTLYPDVIESRSVRGPSQTIKSHHNVGGLPEDDEPQADRAAEGPFQGRSPPHWTGPGYSARAAPAAAFPRTRAGGAHPGRGHAGTHCAVQAADEIVVGEIKRAGLYTKIWQSFAVLLPVMSVGVMGDQRTYAYTCAVRAVHSEDGMTADVAELPWDVLKRISTRIVNEVKGINRVVYDTTSKPPGTIEWE